MEKKDENNLVRQNAGVMIMIVAMLIVVFGYLVTLYMINSYLVIRKIILKKKQILLIIIKM